MEVIRLSPTILTPELGGRILFKSFEPSQGSVPLQTAILTLATYLNPGWKMTVNSQQDITNEANKRSSAYISKSDRGHAIVAVDSISLQIGGAMDAIAGNIGRKASKEQVYELCQQIAEGIIVRDYKYIVLDNGRPGRAGAQAFRSYFSDLVHPGGVSLGVKELNSVFKTVNSRWLTRLEEYGDEDYWIIDIKDHLPGKKYEQAVDTLANTTPAKAAQIILNTRKFKLTSA